MSNVIFGYQIIPEEENEDRSITIDSNSRADEAVRAREQEMLRAKRLKALREAGDDIPEGVEPNEFLDLADSIMNADESMLGAVSSDMGMVSQPVVDTRAAEEALEQARIEAMEIIDEAQQQAQEILNQAQIDGDALKKMAQIDGKKEGYIEGTQKAAMELAESQAKMQQQIDAMQREIEEERLSMERNIVNLCMDTFEKVFGATLSCEPEILYHLLDNCLMNIEATHQMQIRVCEPDAQYLKSRKDDIVERVGTMVTIDIVTDPLMSEGQCIIETDGGLFDCGIDTQLKELIKRIKALA